MEISSSLRRTAGAWWPAAALAAAALLPYLQTVGFGLINLDDYDYVAMHPEVQGGLSAAGLAWALRAVGDGIWMPLTWASYMLDFTLAGGAPGFMHLHGALIHAANAALLYFLLAGLAGGRGPAARAAAFLAAAFWAVHPLRVEAVAWVASRKDVLSLFWELLALLAWVGRLGREGRARAGWLAASLGCFALSAAAKPAAMTFPVLAALLEWLKTGRVGWRDLAWALAPAAAVGALAAYAQGAGGATGHLARVPLWGRALNAAAAFGLYCRETVWPAALAVQCHHRWPGPPRFLVPGLCVCAAYGWAVLRLALRARAGRLPPGGAAALAGLGFFAAAVAPMLGFAPFGIHAFADRFTYLPAVGFSVALAGWLGASGLPGPGKRRAPALGAAALLLAALCALAWRQARLWRGDEPLFLHTLEVDGDRNVTAHYTLGLYYYEFPHDLGRALPHFRRMMELDPDAGCRFASTYIIALCEAGEVGEARRLLPMFAEWSAASVDRFRGRQRDPAPGEPAPEPRRTVPLLVACAAVAIADGQYGVAEDHLGIVEAVQPSSIFAHYLRGRLALARGDRAGALRQWRAALAARDEPYMRHRFLARLVRELEGPARK